MELPPRIFDSGQYRGLPVYEEHLSGLEVGRRTTLKADVLMWNPEGHKMTSFLYNQKFILHAEIPEQASRITLINVRITRDHRGTIVTPDSLSQCLVLQKLKAEHLFNLKETCAGIGALGVGAKFAGWNVVAANEKQSKLAQLLESVSSTKVVVGDIAFGSTIGDLHRADPAPSALAMGFNCQSFSKAGDRKGGDDERAMTLPRGLHAGFLLEAPLIILECVGEAPTFAFVKLAVSQFCEATGFAKSEVILELQHIWVANRQRWWCVLSHGELGQVPLSPFPRIEPNPTVSDFMDEFPLCEEHVMKQLVLAEHEVSQLNAMGTNLGACVVKQHSPLPTALHSWGNQFQGCKCECRSTALSTNRMFSRGFFGVLVKHQLQDGSVIFRHPSAQETALLCGLPMILSGHDARLELCAVGQLASPLQSAWIFSEIRQHLKHQCIGGKEHVSPTAVIKAICDELFAIRAKLWPKMKETIAMQFFRQKINQRFAIDEAFVASNVGIQEQETKETERVVHQNNDRGQEAIENRTIKENVGEKREHQATLSFADQLTSKNAEQKRFRHKCKQIPGAVPGFGCFSSFTEPSAKEEDPKPEIVEEEHETQIGYQNDQDTEVAKTQVDEQAPTDVLFVYQGMGVTPKDLIDQKLVVYHRSQEAVFAVSASDGAKAIDLLKAEGCDNQGYEVRSILGQKLHNEAMLGLHQCVIIQKVGTPAPEGHHEIQLLGCELPRFKLLLVQQGWVAYDEMLFYITALAEKSKVRFVEPLIVMDLEDVPVLTEAWLHHISQVATQGTVITAILWCGHWIPFVFQQGPDQLLGISTEEGVNIWPLTKDENCDMAAEGVVNAVFPNDCGFQSFAWLGARLGETIEQGKMSSDSAESWRFLFWQKLMLNAEQAKQWKYVMFGGHGDELQLAVAAILKDHGVFGERVFARAKEVIDRIGKHEVQQAVASIRPWVAIKQLANKVTPKLTLVWEDEFNQVVKARSKQGNAVGWKRKDGEKTVNPKIQITPEDIVVPPGVFVQDDGSVVHQIAIQQVGSVGKGLVVCTEDEAMQFMHEKCLSTNGLAFAVVNPSSQFVTQNHNPERFPANCVSTQEPVLVSAVLIQKGKQNVFRAEPSNKPKIAEVPVVTAKVLVYKDQIDITWSQFQEGPLKYIVSKVKVLAVCRKHGCTCESWHADEDSTEPLLDVWNRDFLTLGFKKAKPAESEMFACAIRVRADVFDEVVKKSGHAGMYVEPRSADGKSHCDQYHTVWLNKLAHNEALVACAKAKSPAFLIRVNRRYGLKTKMEFANELHSQFKADVPLVSGQASATFTVGPLPWGTTRKGLQELFNSWGWQARALQPAGRAADGKGLLWNALASVPPGASVVQMEHGDVIIVRKEIAPSITPAIPAIEASSHTRKSLQSCPVAAKSEDPWAEAAARLPSVRNDHVLTSQQLHQIEQSLEQKLTKKVMQEDVAMDQAWEPRVRELEEKIAKIVDVQQAQSAQTNAVAQQVQNVQAQVERQSREFQTHLDSKLEDQMGKIEALLTKRARQE